MFVAFLCLLGLNATLGGSQPQAHVPYLSWISTAAAAMTPVGTAQTVVPHLSGEGC